VVGFCLKSPQQPQEQQGLGRLAAGEEDEEEEGRQQVHLSFGHKMMTEEAQGREMDRILSIQKLSSTTTMFYYM